MRKELILPKLTIFVVSSSQLGAEEEHVAHAVELMDGPGIHHYWDSELRVGTSVQSFVEGLDYPAWDLWMLFSPGVRWGDGGSPEPDWWEHQLSSVRARHGERWLDASRFAAKALGFSEGSGTT